MKLFEPGKIGALTIKNRTIMASMGNVGLVELDGRFSPRGLEYFIARARGGIGLITTGCVLVDNTAEKKVEDYWSMMPRIDHDRFISRMSELADAIHDYGAKLSLSLTGGYGRVISRKIFSAAIQPVGPSPLPWLWDNSIVTRELTIPEIETIVKGFELAAERVKRAGVDAIEIHGHEGYLIDQFMTALWNKRTDDYGGDLDGRLRFPVEIIEAIKRGAGSDFPVIFRYGGKHYIPGGREIEESQEIAKQLEIAGADALHIDAGCYEAWHWAHPPTYQEPGCLVDMADAIKKVVKIPVIAVGKLGNPELAERVLVEGKADFIALARPLLADPEWPIKVKEGRWDDIRPCIGCHDGCLARIFSGKYLSCALNPATGMERELAIEPAQHAKSVLVIGGGPGGMEAARVTALRGHRVNLWEKRDKLGGNLIAASVPEFKKDVRDYVQHLSNQLVKLGVNTELKKKASAELVQQMAPDAVILATGATHIIPDIKGVERGNVVTAVELLLGRKEAGENVIVAGGGLIGCEVAAYLGQNGKKVTIIEMLDDISTNMPRTARIQLLEMLAKANVVIFTNTIFLDITQKGALVESRGEKKTIKADTVVLALGLKPDSALIEELRDKVPELHMVGDCVEPRRIINAVWEAYRTARLI